MTRLALILFLGIVTAACSRAPLLAAGPIQVAARPVELLFREPVIPEGDAWELCFAFDPPGDSHHAAAIRAVPLTVAGERVPRDRPTLDRRGESVVCPISRWDDSTADARFGGFRGMELSSDRSVRLRGIRGGGRS